MLWYCTATSHAYYVALKKLDQFTDWVITVIKRTKVTLHQVFLREVAVTWRLSFFTELGILGHAKKM